MHCASLLFSLLTLLPVFLFLLLLPFLMCFFFSCLFIPQLLAFYFILPFLLFWFTLFSSPFWFAFSIDFKTICIRAPENVPVHALNHTEHFTNWSSTFKTRSWTITSETDQRPYELRRSQLVSSRRKFTFRYRELSLTVCVVRLLKH